MWKSVYACIVLGGMLLAVANSITSLAQGRGGFALGYVILIILGSSTMWLVGQGIFNHKESKEEDKKGGD